MINILTSGLRVQQPFLDPRLASDWEQTSNSLTETTGYYKIESSQNLAVGTAGIEFKFENTGLLMVLHYSQTLGTVSTYRTYGGWMGMVGSTQAGLYEVNVTNLTNSQGGTTGITTTSYTMGTWATLDSTRWFKYARDHLTLGTATATFNIQIRRTTDSRVIVNRDVSTIVVINA